MGLLSKADNQVYYVCGDTGDTLIDARCTPAQY